MDLRFEYHGVRFHLSWIARVINITGESGCGKTFTFNALRREVDRLRNSMSELPHALNDNKVICICHDFTYYDIRKIKESQRHVVVVDNADIVFRRCPKLYTEMINNRNNYWVPMGQGSWDALGSQKLDIAQYTLKRCGQGKGSCVELDPIVRVNNQVPCLNIADAPIRLISDVEVKKEMGIFIPVDSMFSGKFRHGLLPDKIAAIVNLIDGVEYRDFSVRSKFTGEWVSLSKVSSGCKAVLMLAEQSVSNSCDELWVDITGIGPIALGVCLEFLKNSRCGESTTVAVEFLVLCG